MKVKMKNEIMHENNYTLLSNEASFLPDSMLSMSRSFFRESTCLSDACNEHFKSSTSLRRTALKIRQMYH